MQAHITIHRGRWGSWGISAPAPHFGGLRTPLLHPKLPRKGFLKPSPGQQGEDGHGRILASPMTPCRHILILLIHQNRLKTRNRSQSSPKGNSGAAHPKKNTSEEGTKLLGRPKTGKNNKKKQTDDGKWGKKRGKRWCPQPVSRGQTRWGRGRGWCHLSTAPPWANSPGHGPGRTCCGVEVPRGGPGPRCGVTAGNGVLETWPVPRCKEKMNRICSAASPNHLGSLPLGWGGNVLGEGSQDGGLQPGLLIKNPRGTGSPLFEVDTHLQPLGM